MGLILSLQISNAQQTSGTVTYERVSQMRARFNINGVESDVPKTQKNNFELLFSGNQSLWKAAEQDNMDEDGGNTPGVQIKMIVMGANDVLYNNLEKGTSVEKKEVFDKVFIVDDSIHKLKWKITGETKMILDKPCVKATATSYTKRMMMNMDNGKMERKEVADTSTIIAWFTSSIPVSAGPGEYQGQLPGLILEMNIKDGTQTYIATAISEKVDVAAIKAPSGKKHFTAEEFKAAREKMMQEMQQNMQAGGRRTVRDN